MVHGSYHTVGCVGADAVGGGALVVHTVVHWEEHRVVVVHMGHQSGVHASVARGPSYFGDDPSHQAEGHLLRKVASRSHA